MKSIHNRILSPSIYAINFNRINTICVDCKKCKAPPLVRQFMQKNLAPFPIFFLHNALLTSTGKRLAIIMLMR